jgi:hypothetical protein
MGVVCFPGIESVYSEIVGVDALFTFEMIGW